MKKLAVIAVLLTLGACGSTQVVTDIQGDGRGNITATQCTMIYNGMAGKISIEDCRTKAIK